LPGLSASRVSKTALIPWVFARHFGPLADSGLPQSPLRFSSGIHVPELVTFQGRPVKRRRRVRDGLLKLTFVSPVPGEPGAVLVVSQDEWLRYGRVRFFAKGKMPNQRALASRFTT
jgi:hypothetical protein